MPTIPPPLRRLVVLGNSGSGKSTLALALAAERGLAHLDLDTVAWSSADPPTRAPLHEAGAAVLGFLGAHDGWVVEGCYADLAAVALDHADGLVLLDLPVAACQAHARSRPWEPHKFPSPEAQDALLGMLLDWIAGYPDRDGDLGRPAHLARFDAFRGWKVRWTGGEP